MCDWITHENPGSHVVRVRAVPGAKKPGIAGVQGDRLKVRVSAPPEDGRANKAIIALLALSIGVRESDIEHVSGKTHREKSFRISGACDDRLRALGET